MCVRVRQQETSNCRANKNLLWLWGTKIKFENILKENMINLKLPGLLQTKLSRVNGVSSEQVRAGAAATKAWRLH